MTDDPLAGLGLSPNAIAKAVGVGERNMRRWRRSTNQMPPAVRDILVILRTYPEAFVALRDDYRPDDPSAGPAGVYEPERRLLWLRAFVAGRSA